VTPNPDAQYTHSCDYVLGNFQSFTPDGYRFIASASIHNTGNIGVVVKVKAHWVQVGSAPILMTKTATLGINHSTTVNFTKDVGQDNIDLIQADESGDNCGVTVSLLHTFGSAQGD
jgi:hypothetical protein